MIQLHDKISINLDQTIGILTDHTQRHGVYIDLDRAIEYKVNCIELVLPLLKEWRDMAGDSGLSPNAPKEIMSILVNRFGVDANLLMEKGKMSISSKVREKLLKEVTVGESPKRFIKLLDQISPLMKIIGTMTGYITDLPLCHEESFDGHRMVLAKPTWNPLVTGRISAKDPGIQTIAKKTSDLITHPAGKILLRSDSGQIEPRITYSAYVKDPLLKQLIIVYNDAYWGMLRFILMTPEEEAAARADLSSIVPIELPKEQRKELKVLLLAGNYGGGLEGHDPVLSNGFINKIQKHPLRIEWERQVREEVRQGQSTFYSYFGTPISPEKSQSSTYEYGSNGWFEHMVRCGINNPIQGTASDLMRESVYQADKLIRENARGETWIGYYKHDEGCFYIDEKDADLAKELEEVVSYQVDDWIPIYGDAEYGVKYPEFKVPKIEW